MFHRRTESRRTCSVILGIGGVRLLSLFKHKVVKSAFTRVLRYNIRYSLIVSAVAQSGSAGLHIGFATAHNFGLIAMLLGMRSLMNRLRLILHCKSPLQRRRLMGNRMVLCDGEICTVPTLVLCTIDDSTCRLSLLMN